MLINQPLWRTSVGRKIVMAFTGVALFGFILLHLLGNLLFFEGAVSLNGYAAALRGMPLGALWIIRGGLVAVFLMHIWLGVRLTLSSWSEAEVKTRGRGDLLLVWSSRKMILSGVFILVFLLFHLLHFAMRVLAGSFYGGAVPAPGDLFSMIQGSFLVPEIAIFYLIALYALAIHLAHGLASSLQTFGIRYLREGFWFETFPRVLSWLVAVGFVTLPLLILLKIGEAVR